MTHPLITKCLAAQAEVDSAVALFKEHAARQISIMKELIERLDMPELKLDKRLSGLFSFDYIEVEVYHTGQVNISVWEDAYADFREENVGEFYLSEHIINGNDADFRLEYEAKIAQMAEELRTRMWANRQAEIAYARAALAKLEGQS